MLTNFVECLSYMLNHSVFLFLFSQFLLSYLHANTTGLGCLFKGIDLAVITDGTIDEETDLDISVTSKRWFNCTLVQFFFYFILHVYVLWCLVTSKAALVRLPNEKLVYACSAPPKRLRTPAVPFYYEMKLLWCCCYFHTRLTNSAWLSPTFTLVWNMPFSFSFNRSVISTVSGCWWFVSK